MRLRFALSGVLKPYDYVVWDKSLKKVRRYNSNDSPCDIIAIYDKRIDVYDGIIDLEIECHKDDKSK